jgi:hypothetical protein
MKITVENRLGEKFEINQDSAQVGPGIPPALVTRIIRLLAVGASIEGLPLREGVTVTKVETAVE